MTRMRSLLFVPGDSEKKLAKSEGIPADVLILDLEDSVSPENKQSARGRVVEFLSARAVDSRRQVWVRINSLAAGRSGSASIPWIMPKPALTWRR